MEHEIAAATQLALPCFILGATAVTLVALTVYTVASEIAYSVRRRFRR